MNVGRDYFLNELFKLIFHKFLILEIISAIQEILSNTIPVRNIFVEKRILIHIFLFIAICF